MKKGPASHRNAARVPRGERGNGPDVVGDLDEVLLVADGADEARDVLHVGLLRDDLGADLVAHLLDRRGLQPTRTATNEKKPKGNNVVTSPATPLSALAQHKRPLPWGRQTSRRSSRGGRRNRRSPKENRSPRSPRGQINIKVSKRTTAPQSSVEIRSVPGGRRWRQSSGTLPRCGRGGGSSPAPARATDRCKKILPECRSFMRKHGVIR